MTEATSKRGSAGASNRESQAPSLAVGTELQDRRYVITGLLGRGSQGETFEAIDKSNGALVAIKRFSIRGAESWKQVELAEREIRVLSQLSHPALPAHLDHFEADGALLLVMSRVHGESLASKLERSHIFPGGYVLKMIWELAGVLAYLRGVSPPVVHRDIKPSNIIQTGDSSFSLVDFGSVKDRLKPDGSTIVGTYGYMAPEQFQGRALPVSDVYGLGATALSLLTGLPPDEQPHQGLRIDVKQALGAGSDPRLVQLLSWMLDPDPDQRLVDIHAAFKHLYGPDLSFLGVGEQPASRAPHPHEASASAPRGARTNPFSTSESPRQRWRQRSSGPWSNRRPPTQFAPPLAALFVLGLFVARAANTMLLGLLIPLVLYLISPFFGKRVKSAAQRLRLVARRGNAGMRRAASYIKSKTKRGGASPDAGAQGHTGDAEGGQGGTYSYYYPRGKQRVVDTTFEPAEGAPPPPKKTTNSSSNQARPRVRVDSSDEPSIDDWDEEQNGAPPRAHRRRDD